MKKTILSILAVGLLAGPMVANAFPVTLSPSNPVYFNIDLTGETPSAPYTSIGLNWDITGSSYADIRSFLYSGLNADTLVWAGSIGGLIVGIGSNCSGCSGLMDGIFSVGLSTSVDTFEIASLCAVGYLNGVGTDCVPATAVPEPSTLALFGLGLLGLGFARRRKLN